MLQMKKNFIGLAAVAVALAGCSTTPKTYTDADFNRFDIPGYGASRDLASPGDPEVLLEAWKGLEGVRGMTKTAAGVSRSASTELVQFVNGSGIPEVAALRAKYGQLTEKQFALISGENQVKLAKGFFDKNYYKNNKNLASVRARVDSHADTFAEGHVEEGASAGKVKKTSQPNEPKAAVAGKKMGLKEVLTDLIETSPALQSQDGKDAVGAMGDAVKKLYEITGGQTSVFQKMTCEVVQDVATVKAYTDMTNAIIKELVAAGVGPKSSCSNLATIEAAGLLAFQKEMGRVGNIGREAAKEMGEACPIVPKTISAAVDRIPEDGRTPACAL